ncbi:peptidoglycan hydrolase-like protein with peptidoglycan-binding domain [Pararhizobium capsulatum DSM 1112]|uniref:Peptidoglycan hydrolase-like protein with peptidoglycan-binding domain n=1 Tax=Pararhizobium capsulatum DSM 1112 TaxID=1121113 RepID=A0ABU0BPY7_9HYPH|nr:L,D-transpeptidase family protein [Pararhizobium capsulatum]MDQ0320310.1 peptidoglycan hydrolase-like protein with peptidoglycan-binding domain [Pararhizobium capsulatum DSM 1112]
MVQRIAFRSSLLALALAASTALGTGNVLGATERPLQIIVSKDQQSLVVYDGDTVVATSHVSTGKKGHATPTGIFSILQKARHHRSNIYSDAPMPFMQRLTWSGIALHASGQVPPYPASHGCVRMPDDFAKTLFGMTEHGMHVLISDKQVLPTPVSHAFLFQPKAEAPPLLSDVELRPTGSQLPSSTQPVEIAMGEPADKPAESALPSGPPVRMLITWRGQRETTMDAQNILIDLGFNPGLPDGVSGSQTVEAIAAFQKSENLPPDGRVTAELLSTLYKKTNRGTPANGQILVRRDFAPVFEAPITIAEPHAALGTHFFQFHSAADADNNGSGGSWFATTLDNALPKTIKARLGLTDDSDSLAFNAAERTLDRLSLNAETRQKIEKMLADGSSLTITDNGLGQETGKGTDFVTITYAGPKG